MQVYQISSVKVHSCRTTFPPLNGGVGMRLRSVLRKRRGHRRHVAFDRGRHDHDEGGAQESQD